jgi:hypothetical protein
MERANAILAGAEPGILDRLPAIERRKWELVRAGDVAALIVLINAQRTARPSLRVRIARRNPEQWRRRLRGAYYDLRRR